MMLLSKWPSPPLWGIVLVDATTLLVALFPVLYLLVLRPLTRHIAERAQAEEKLLASDREKAKAQAMSHVGSWQVHPATNVMRASDELLHILGLGRDDVSLEAFASVIHPDDLASALEILQRGMALGVRYEIEHRLLLRDGTVKWVHTIGDPVVDSAGTVEMLVGTTQNITERKMAEEALKSAKDFAENLIETANVIFVELNLRGEVVRINPLAEGLSGYSLNDVKGKNWFELLTPRARYPEVWAEFEQITERGEVPRTFENPILTKSGQERLIVWQNSLVHRGGEISGTISFGVDITERKQAERALRESDAKHVAMVANISDVIGIIGLDGVMKYKSPNIERWSGWKPEDLVGTDGWATVHPDDLVRIQGEFGLVITGHGPRTVEYRYKCKDGSYKPIELTAADLTKDPVIGGVLLNYHDITERKQAQAELIRLQAQLQQAEKMESVGRLAGGVAHDYNNMLAVIIGHAELGLLRSDAPPALRDDLTEIHKAATHSAEITQQLLTFARKQVIRPQRLDLNATVAHLLKMLRPLIGEQVQFAWHPAADLWPVTMDATQVEQILTNLCLNARDAITGVGTVVVTTANRVADAALCETLSDAVPGAYVQLTVTDSGRGMSRAVLARVFEPFYTTKGVGEGSGLGLASVYGAVRQNGGFVGVASVEGEGTTFDIYLPRREGTLATPATPEPVAPMPKGHETILVVEDEPAVRRMTVRALEGQGYTVLTAAGPREAIRLAQERGGGVALLLTDVQMPEMSGHDLAAALRSAQPHVKHLFMSGFPMRPSGDDGQMEDAAHFLAKPFTLSALTAKVREVLDGR